MNITKELALQVINKYAVKTGYLCVYCKDDNGVQFEILYKESFISIFPEGVKVPKNFKGYKGGTSLHFKDGKNFYLTCNADRLLSFNKVPYLKAVSLSNKYEVSLKELLTQKSLTKNLKETISLQKQIYSLCKTTREQLKTIYDKVIGEQKDFVCEMILDIK
jgi:hypothetical protein